MELKIFKFHAFLFLPWTAEFDHVNDEEKWSAF
jgi:hypothetical protein